MIINGYAEVVIKNLIGVNRNGNYNNYNNKEKKEAFVY
jgi:hypothetical protein